MFKIPKTVTISGQTYKIIYKDEITLDDMECDGLCCPGAKEVLINSQLDCERTLQTFAHELTHVIVAETAISRMLVMNNIDEELFVEVFSKGVFDFLKGLK